MYRNVWVCGHENLQKAPPGKHANINVWYLLGHATVEIQGTIPTELPRRKQIQPLRAPINVLHRSSSVVDLNFRIFSM